MHMVAHDGPALQVAVVSPRPAVHLLMREMAEAGANVVVSRIDVSLTEVEAGLAALEPASVAVIDISLDASEALDFCTGVHSERPGLPLVALVCCPQCLGPRQFRALLDGVFQGVVGLRSTAGEVRRVLNEVAQGGCIIQLHIDRTERSLLRRLVSSDDRAREGTVGLLQLLTLGLSDRDIGERLHLSPHTVKHHIEALRQELGARNRTELAAWAGRHGFYLQEADEAEPGASRKAQTAS